MSRSSCSRGMRWHLYPDLHRPTLRTKTSVDVLNASYLESVLDKSVCRVNAVLTRDVRRLVAQEELDQVCNLLRLAHTTKRDDLVPIKIAGIRSFLVHIKSIRTKAHPTPSRSPQASQPSVEYRSDRFALSASSVSNKQKPHGAMALMRMPFVATSPAAHLVIAITPAFEHCSRSPWGCRTVRGYLTC
jgi:hypothetical protein